MAENLALQQRRRDRGAPGRTRLGPRTPLFHGQPIDQIEAHGDFVALLLVAGSGVVGAPASTRRRVLLIRRKRRV